MNLKPLYGLWILYMGTKYSSNQPYVFHIKLYLQWTNVHKKMMYTKM